MLMRLPSCFIGASSYAHPHEKNNGPAGIATTGYESVCCETRSDRQDVRFWPVKGSKRAIGGSFALVKLAPPVHEAIYDPYYPEWKLPVRGRTL